MEPDDEDVPILIDTTSPEAAPIVTQTKPLDPEKTRVPITIITGDISQHARSASVLLIVY